MKEHKSYPGAKRLIESLRFLGYDCSTAIADLIDNSIAADASEIFIDILPKLEARQDILPPQEYRPAAIIIADNGKGMDGTRLQEAMRYGTLQEHYSSDDLGKYGLGLKTASLSQCRTLTVASKAKSAEGIRPRRHYMRWDIDRVSETNEWNLIELDEDDLKPWEKRLLNQEISGENGTVVLWSNFDSSLSLLLSNDPREREKYLAHLIDDIGGYLRMVFHRYMQGIVPGHKKVNIRLCGKEPLIPWDPYCRNETTEELDILRLPFSLENPEGSMIDDVITVAPFILPRENEFSSQAAWKDASGQKGWNQQQGLYFYRNYRLLQAGGWCRLRTPDEHTKLMRICIDFPSKLDHAFAINVTKMRANIPPEIRDTVESHVSTWVKMAKARYDDSTSVSHTPTSFQQTSTVGTTPGPGNPVNNPAANNSPVVSVTQVTGPTSKAAVPDIRELLKNKTGKWNPKDFCSLLLTILEGVYRRTISTDQIPVDELKQIFRDQL